MFKNVIVGQSGGPTSVINSSLVGVYKTAMDRGASKIYGMVHGIEGLIKGEYVDLSCHIQSDLDIELLKRTPSSFLGSCRYKLPEVGTNDELYNKIFDILNELEIGYFFYIGGNDSMDTIQKLTDYGLKINSDIVFMGVPKTIDNDLAVTDHTPGYGSAAKFIASVSKELIRDGLVYDTKSVTIIEIMGRNAGWLTGAAALAKGDDCEGVDMILLPEHPFDMDNFLNKIVELQKSKKSLVIAVSEGIRNAQGICIAELDSHASFTDAFGHTILQGAGRYLANTIAEKIGCKSRCVELSTLQRCASHLVSRVDITEAFQVGGAAVKLAFEGKSGQVVVLKRISDDPYICITDSYDVHEIANVEKKVPTEWITNDGTYVSDDFLNYIRPLVQAELTPTMVSGLPAHLRLLK